YFFDIIFNSTTAIAPITDAWFANASSATLYGREVKILPPTELIWSKMFVQDRYKYDGSDVAHIIVRRSDEIDWERLLSYTEQYWEVLLIHILNFRFIYPTERERVPKRIFDELLERLTTQVSMPAPE